jgi:putative copper export protein
VGVSGWEVVAICAKAATYAATLGAAGAIFFSAYCKNLLQDSQQFRIRRLIGRLLIIATLASLARIPLLAGSMSGDFAGMFDSQFENMILRNGEGRTTGLRLIGLALMAIGVFSNRRATPLLGAVIAAVSFAWIGHVYAMLPNALPRTLLCLHLLCAAFWFGALAPLLMVAQGGTGSQAASVAARFATWAFGLVAVLIVAGAWLVWMLIRDAAEFWDSDYGRMLLVKLLLVACLLATAALNKFYLTTKLSRGDAKAALRFSRSLQAEMLLGSLILLATAAFTSLTGPP